MSARVAIVIDGSNPVGDGANTSGAIEVDADTAEVTLVSVRQPHGDANQGNQERPGDLAIPNAGAAASTVRAATVTVSNSRQEAASTDAATDNGSMKRKRCDDDGANDASTKVPYHQPQQGEPQQQQPIQQPMQQEQEQQKALQPFHPFHLAMLKALYEQPSAFASLDEGRVDRHVWSLIHEYMDQRKPIKERITNARYSNVASAEAKRMMRALSTQPQAAGITSHRTESWFGTTSNRSAHRIPTMNAPSTAGADGAATQQSSMQGPRNRALRQISPASFGFIANLLHKKADVTRLNLKRKSTSIQTLQRIVQKRIHGLTKYSDRKSRVMFERRTTNPRLLSQNDECTISHLETLMELWTLLFDDLCAHSEIS
mmetsp:Transcript_11441/g.31683  ORF Transcript_11441/g.31683 Transcript_11441/m.31683 type:complete len:373 (+) Transcript_11441:279-1397(+)